jgi:hypothetical protein
MRTVRDYKDGSPVQIPMQFFMVLFLESMPGPLWKCFLRARGLQYSIDKKTFEFRHAFEIHHIDLETGQTQAISLQMLKEMADAEDGGRCPQCGSKKIRPGVSPQKKALSTSKKRSLGAGTKQIQVTGTPARA